MATVTQAALQGQKLQRSRFTNILVATDFSSAAQKALQYGVAIAKQFSGEITIVHAIAPEPREFVPMDPVPREIDSAYAKAELQMSRLGKQPWLQGIPHRTVLQHGAPGNVISVLIAREKIDLLVLGTRGRAGIAKLALGSVAEELLRTAGCPVLTVGPHVPATTDVANFKQIVFATDFGVASKPAFDCAAEIADRSKAKLILLHTVAPLCGFETIPTRYTPPATLSEAVAQWEDRVREQNLSKLRQLVCSYSKETHAEYAVNVDLSPIAISDFMAVHKPDLLVMGAKRPKSAGLTAHLPWSVVHGVLCSACCPVLTVSA